MSYRYNKKPAYRRPEVDVKVLMKGLAANGTAVNLSDEIKRHKPVLDVEISPAELVASYNWAASGPDSKPTIIVPGSPAEWINKPVPFSVPRDTGLAYIDQNAHFFPEAPITPLIASVKYLRPDYKLGSVDMITSRNNLRKLIRWIDSQTTGNPMDSFNGSSFRIDLQVVGEKTVIFRRWEAKSTEMGGVGYGHNFEEVTTKAAKGCEGSNGHHRIITYDFNGLKVMLGHEVDACLPPKTAQSSTPIDDVLSGIETLNFNQTSQNEIKTINIISGGRAVQPNDTIEIKTSSILSAGKPKWDEYYPQLLFSHTQNLYVAIHQSGRFNQINRYELGKGALKDAEVKARGNMTKLRVVLGALIDMALKSGKDTPLTVICNNGELKVHRRMSGSNPIPEHLTGFFDS